MWAPKESVDCWPLATAALKTFGGLPKPVPFLPWGECDRLPATSSWGMHVAVHGFRPRGCKVLFCGGPSPGELSGGNWISRVASSLVCALGPAEKRSSGGNSVGRSFGPFPRVSGLANYPGPPFLGGPLGGDIAPRAVFPSVNDSYLVDSASSHMLVSKIKPCMSKYKQSIR